MTLQEVEQPRGEEAMREAELDDDVKERDEFIERLLQRDEGKTRKYDKKVSESVWRPLTQRAGGSGRLRQKDRRENM